MIRPARALALIAALAAGGCPGPEDPATPASPPPSTTPAADDPDAFSEKRAWAHLRALCALGPRGHATPGWRAAQDLIREHLRACGVEPRTHTFEYPPRSRAPLATITARFKGQRSDAWVLIGSHYDTRLWADEDDREALQDQPIEGANDGGSGTAVLLELATVFSKSPPPIDVELVFFDGEDFGQRRTKDYMLGSKDMVARWADYFPSRPSAAVILDMVGDLDLAFRREASADAQVPWLNDTLWAAAGRAGYGEVFAESQLQVWDDHTALLEHGVPATLLIDFTYPFWHTADDTLDKCSPRSLRVTGEVLREWLNTPRLAQPPEPPAGPR